MKLVRETLLQDIEVCATVVRPVRKAHLTNHHTKRPMAFYDWLTYARRQVAAQWTLNSNPHICTSSVASIISTDDIMNGHPNDADSWSFIATPKDRDTIGIGKAEAEYQDKADYFVVLQSRVHIPRQDIIECFERALQSTEERQVQELEILQRVIALLTCVAERGAANRLHRNATALGFEVDEGTADIYAKRIMPFSSDVNVATFGLHLPQPKTVRTIDDGLYEKYQWRQCTLSVRNNLRPFIVPSGEEMLGIVQGATDLGPKWARDGLHVHIGSDDEGVLARSSRVHAGWSNKWNFLVCPHFMERRRNSKDVGFKDVLANLNCVHVDLHTLQTSDL